MKPRSKKRAKQEREYSSEHRGFLNKYRICPVTGQRTTQIHHSAKREGEWLNLKRYWIAVSMDGHQWIEDHKTEAEKYDLMVRVNLPYRDHLQWLITAGENPHMPVFYEKRKGVLVNEKGKPIWKK